MAQPTGLECIMTQRWVKKKKPQVISLTSLATSQSTGNNQGNLFYITTTGTPPLHSVFFVRCLHCAYRYVVLGVLCIYLVLRV